MLFCTLTVLAAEETRDDYRLTEKHLYQIKEDIRKLEEELSMDFGPHHEFVFMHRECYEITNEYVYKICPFHKVTQKSKQGGMETLLGVWGSWAGSEENKYSMMKFEDGAPCWQGPYRSVQVKLLCGEQTAVMSSAEPSHCEYLFELQTPAACNQPAPALKHEEL
ncbi:glucosidase 2 subunit beta-like [Acipenser ruthenus]|uniref:glucosidase 2 subunit beta-like n=1 Tax=Acipenser ruthenus TaxID=7906 RepID=UPI0027424FFB|nr:glucosidase 2 subunit beta-like [Acipenser ruthenus]